MYNDQYNENNIFNKIINNEIKANIVLKTEHTICFYDINPKAKFHVLFIPKIKVQNYHEFIETANQEEQLDFFSSINKVIKQFDLIKNGYQIIANTGKFANQEVLHFHMHLLSKI